MATSQRQRINRHRISKKSRSKASAHTGSSGLEDSGIADRSGPNLWMEIRAVLIHWKRSPALLCAGVK
jgi:hypothetical protein